MATTEGGSTREYFAEHAPYFDPPRRRRGPRRGARDAFHAPRTWPLAGERTLAHYTWDRIALTQKDAYEQVLARHARAASPA